MLDWVGTSMMKRLCVTQGSISSSFGVPPAKLGRRLGCMRRLESWVMLKERPTGHVLHNLGAGSPLHVICQLSTFPPSCLGSFQ